MWERGNRDLGSGKIHQNGIWKYHMDTSSFMLNKNTNTQSWGQSSLPQRDENMWSMKSMTLRWRMECKFRVLLLSCVTLENTKPSVNYVMKNRLLKSLFVVIYYGNREMLPVPNKKSWKSIKGNVFLFVLIIQVLDKSLDGIEWKENIVNKNLKLGC